MRALLEDILSPARLDAVEAEVERRLRAEERSGEADKTRRRVAQLDRDIENGNRRLLLLPEDRIPGVTRELRKLEGERKGLVDRLADLEGGGKEVKAVLTEARRQLWRLREGLLADDLEAQTAVIREVVSRAEVRFELRTTSGRRNPAGRGRVLSVPVGLKLYVRPGLGLEFNVPLGSLSL
jgi:hypothetical protein